jgi:hypothetical protein
MDGYLVDSEFKSSGLIVRLRCSSSKGLINTLAVTLVTSVKLPSAADENAVTGSQRRFSMNISFAT